MVTKASLLNHGGALSTDNPVLVEQSHHCHPPTCKLTQWSRMIQYLATRGQYTCTSLQLTNDLCTCSCMVSLPEIETQVPFGQWSLPGARYPCSCWLSQRTPLPPGSWPTETDSAFVNWWVDHSIFLGESTKSSYLDYQSPCWVQFTCALNIRDELSTLERYSTCSTVSLHSFENKPSPILTSKFLHRYVLLVYTPL